jgi:hypothetical protein
MTDAALDRASRTVLVVDNDEFSSELAEVLLHDIGVGTVRTAGDGFAALAILDGDEIPDVIFLDLDMEGMDGIEVLRSLATRRYEGALALMTGSGNQLVASVQRMALANNLRIIGTVQKPLHREKFAAVLDELARGPQRRGGYAVTPLHPDEIREGLARDAIELYVQPKVTVRTREVRGGEVLLRWRGADGSLVSPLAVIPVAEEHGLIEAITKSVYAKTVTEMRGWRALGWNPLISVNVSAIDLLDLDFPRWLTEVTAEAGVESRSLVLEVTESQIVEHLSSTLDVVSRLYLNGFRFSIDDFGTGYSNFEQLKQLPLSELKIDRSLVVGATEDSAGRAILASSIQLGHALGVRVVGEGVETLEDWALLDSLGCDVIQGYFVARPMPISSFYAWRTTWVQEHHEPTS